MSSFFRSWKESLSLFVPKNAKLFILVTLKTIIQSYVLIVRQLWWLILVSWAVDVIGARYFGPNSLFTFVPLFSWLITIFCMYLAIRPSLKRKQFEYYKAHIWYFIPFFIVTIFSYITLVATLKLLVIVFPNLSDFLYLSVITLLLLPSPLSPLFIAPPLTFTILFALDNNTSIKNLFLSIIRGYKMAFYNYPFCLFFFIICVLFSIMAWIGVILLSTSFASVGHMSILTSSLASHILLPIPICVWTNFYTKRLHDQFAVYYPQTAKE